MTRSMTLQRRMAQRRLSEATNWPSPAPTTATTSAEQRKLYQDQTRAVRACQTSAETAATRAQNREQMRAVRAACRQDQVQNQIHPRIVPIHYLLHGSAGRH